MISQSQSTCFKYVFIFGHDEHQLLTHFFITENRHASFSDINAHQLTRRVIQSFILNVLQSDRSTKPFTQIIFKRLAKKVFYLSGIFSTRKESVSNKSAKTYLHVSLINVLFIFQHVSWLAFNRLNWLIFDTKISLKFLSL